VPYTLVKFLLWFGLAAVVGVAIGWALRSLRARAELSALRGTQVDAEELGRLRGQRDNLDEVLAERDRLRALVADLQSSQIGKGVASTEPTDAVPDEPSAGSSRASSQDGSQDGSAETSSDASQGGSGESTEAVEPEVTPADAGVGAGPLDAVAAAVVLGRAIEIDDLTVVEGIGPKIAELCRGVGITTWQELADTNADELRSMLHDAGSRYRVHRPDTWPAQASLLARGAWSEFVAFTDDLGSRS
jgi:predicted flap endonuclease-1-like 5' DNA nuclease/cell division protein FtsB